jgi:hypothetical protein
LTTQLTVYGVQSDRATALFFDILVQNSSISPTTKAQILGDFQRLSPDLSDDQQEVERLKIIANRRAEAAKPQWVEDVRGRKMTIAQGEGTVHGRYYNLKEQYGIGL